MQKDEVMREGGRRKEGGREEKDKRTRGRRERKGLTLAEGPGSHCTLGQRSTGPLPDTVCRERSHDVKGPPDPKMHYHDN